MASVSTYLNFTGETEVAFAFYKSVFGTEYASPVSRYRDIPPSPEQPSFPESALDLVMHVSLPITGGHVLMGSDVMDEYCVGGKYIAGNNVLINLEPDTRAETERLIAALSADGGKITMPLADMFWGAYFGAVTDQFGIHWMLNCTQQP